MRVFRELKLSGSKIQLENAVEQMENHLTDGWTRDRDQEDMIASDTSNEMVCFSCADRESRESANLWLVYRNDNTQHSSKEYSRSNGRSI